MPGNKSPLPGWDPYLQRFWRDVHQSLVVYTRDSLRGQLPPELRVRAEERVFLETSDLMASAHKFIPDVSVLQRRNQDGGRVATLSGEILVAEPVRISIQTEPVTEGYIEIRDASSGGRLITTI